jgi:hypothetical protein
MPASDEKLKAISDQLKSGIVPPKESVRSFLRSFSAERRGYNVVNGIRQQLKKHGLTTVPDFDYQYIDGLIGFALATNATQVDVNTSSIDPTYRVGRLPSANKTPVSVKPDASLQEAITLMMTHSYSQLPVLTTPREVKGMVSWKSIGSRLALKRPCLAVRDCMETAEIVSIDASLFSAINTVAIHDYVLVQANDKTICGIVAASDFNDQFLALAEPFLLVGEIEHGVRQMLHGKFTAKELEEVKAPGEDDRTIGAITDLTFGEYIKLLQTEKAWQKLNLAIDRVEFISRLDKIRIIRNDVMHFDPDGIEPSDLTSLRDFARFLKSLRDLGAV